MSFPTNILVYYNNILGFYSSPIHVPVSYGVGAVQVIFLDKNSPFLFTAGYTRRNTALEIHNSIECL